MAKKTTIQVAYDDGAGDGKWVARHQKQELRFKIRSLVAPSGGDDALGYGQQHVQIELPNSKSDATFNGLLYSIGDHLARRADLQPDTTAIRYIAQPNALIRFYAGLGRIVEEFGLDGVVGVNLTAGINTEYFTRYRKNIEDMFCGDHYFRRNGRDVRVDVESVTVGPQAYFAAQAVISAPPEKLRDILAQYPMGENPAIVIDIGNFSTDIAVLIGDEKDIYPESFFAINRGVGEVRRQIQDHALQVLRQSLTNMAIDKAITPGPGYGFLPNVITGRGQVDVTKTVDAVIKNTWMSIWTEISRRLRDTVTKHYVIVTGGGSIVFGDEINRTPLGLDSMVFADHPAMVLTRSEWAVVEGMGR